MIELNKISALGHSLNRPECVLSHSSGLLFTSDWSEAGGVSIVSPNGNVQKIISNESEFIVRPNGVGVEQSGSFLVAHLGNEDGGVYRLHPSGDLEEVLTMVDGENIPPSNYIHIDHLGRFWVTVSTKKNPRATAYKSDVADGFIILIDKNGAKVVADNLGYTNECLVHPDGNRLFVNETFARSLTSFDIDRHGCLSNRKTICEFGAGTFPDGMTFDSDGGIWITSIISNRVIRVKENGSQTLFIEDVDTAHLDEVERAFESNNLGRPHLDQVKSDKLKNISSLAFGGKNLQTAFLGCLLDERIYCFNTTYTGIEPNHWNAPLNKLFPFLKNVS